MDHISTIFNTQTPMMQHQQQDTNNSDFNLNFNLTPHTLLHNSTPVTQDSVTHAEQVSTNGIDVAALQRQLYKIKDELDAALRSLGAYNNLPQSTSAPHIPEPFAHKQQSAVDENIVEGVFNGEKMIGPDGKEYAIPPNYASKSKLVEGDIMKLTITQIGKFIYKQIAPVERKRVVGKLLFDEATQFWFVEHNEKRYKILTASATFYKGKPEDDAVILLPIDGKADWGAVENIISR